VKALSDGAFVNQGPMQHGQSVQCGPGALLDLQGIAVVVTSAVLPANDPAFFAHHGVALERTRLLCVKAKNHFHAAFAPRCAAIIEVDAPGPAMADLSQLPFAHWPAPSPAAPRA
jgi:microcystin degradation protein MlrC